MSARPPIVHPGPAARERHALAWAAAVPLDFTLARGEAAETGLARAVAAAGCDSACVEISGGRFDPFRYVLPAASPVTSSPGRASRAPSSEQRSGAPLSAAFSSQDWAASPASANHRPPATSSIFAFRTS